MTHGLAGNKPVSEGADNSRTARAALVLVAVEKRGKASGRARMSVIPDFKAATIIPCLTENVAPGSTIYTDGLKSFADLAEAGFKHVARNQPLRSELRKGTKSAVPLAESGHWEPPAMADRHLPRSEQGPTPGLSRRIRLSA